MTETTKEYKNPVCRGSHQLGTACGTCERCVDEQNRLSDERVQKNKVYMPEDPAMANLCDSCQ